jgi:hypothetical protein
MKRLVVAAGGVLGSLAADWQQRVDAMKAITSLCEQWRCAARARPAALTRCPARRSNTPRKPSALTLPSVGDIAEQLLPLAPLLKVQFGDLRSSVVRAVCAAPRRSSVTTPRRRC